ncbi:MAG: PEP-CTERM sorting domain-containing protein [Thermoguttaceae bacterium]|jgi:hypothetical protein
MRRFIVGLAGVVVLVLAGVGAVRAATVSFDFTSGAQPYFRNFGDLSVFNVDTSGAVRIYKSADDRTYQGDQNIGAGVWSLFQLTGDFSVTVDYTLTDFPTPTDYGTNETQFFVMSQTYGPYFSIWRRKGTDGENHIFAWGSSSGGEFGSGDQVTTDNSGQYRITRTGTVLTAEYRPTGNNDFTTIASAPILFPPGDEPMWILLEGCQERTGVPGLRADTSLDVTYDNLVIQADGFEGSIPSPEPSTLALLGVGFVSLVGYGWRRRVTRRHSQPEPQDDDPPIPSFPLHAFDQPDLARRAA